MFMWPLEGFPPGHTCHTWAGVGKQLTDPRPDGWDWSGTQGGSRTCRSPGLDLVNQGFVNHMTGTYS